MTYVDVHVCTCVNVYTYRRRGYVCTQNGCMDYPTAHATRFIRLIKNLPCLLDFDGPKESERTDLF